jgi:hypothetical protein
MNVNFLLIFLEKVGSSVELTKIKKLTIQPCMSLS